MTLTKARLEARLPGKRSGAERHARALQGFMLQVYTAMRDRLPLDKLACVLV
eukprot:CAMPEP_0198423044 /NCGR_PEP_ID=MMETSP1452-20131203/2811_1 /TAXON_ID=1181717 /ORGANISM="Synchroma pusillum, Strain CCMP3072" /LENGTH=51 /DNA_ID=CAMNT_0044143323 /DNA_START=47 /DNA_END=199 /DNA_ORIENTATION=-